MIELSLPQHDLKTSQIQAYNSQLFWMLQLILALNVLNPK